MSEEFILRGPPAPELPDCSFAQYFLPKLKSFDKNKVFMIDGESGKSKTSWQYLTTALKLLEGMRKLGLQEKDVIAMLCRNSFEAEYIMLGSWLGNAVPAPMNGYMTTFEFKHYFKLINPKFIFCEEEMLGNVVPALIGFSTSPIIILSNKSQNSPNNYLSFEEVLAEVNVDEFNVQPVESPSDQLILISPSSGTSGLPKAIGLTHRNMIFQGKVLEKFQVLNDKITFCQVSHFFWISGTVGLMSCLITGMKHVFVRNVNSKNTLDIFAKHKVNCSLMSPLSLVGLTQCPEFHKYDLSSVKFIFSSGSVLSEGSLQKIKNKWPDLKVFQGYGMTEASGNICTNMNVNTSVGKVSSGISLKIIDTKTGESLKANIMGELCVKSPGLMKCYVGNEDATKESIDEDGWFHTGDVGYYDDSENIYIVERIKEMIKVRDMQVVPSELENVISEVPGVLEVGVAGVLQEDETYRLVALIVRKAGHHVSEKDIHSHIEKTLSDYKKLTGGIFFIDAIPKTGSGKIKRSELKIIAKNCWIE